VRAGVLLSAKRNPGRLVANTTILLVIIIPFYISAKYCYMDVFFSRIIFKDKCSVRVGVGD